MLKEKRKMCQYGAEETEVHHEGNACESVNCI
jgi:hypothetical protein